MVTRWGLSDRLGPQTYSEESGEVFLGRSVTQHKQVSDVTAHVIDEEVRRVIDSNYQRAYKILQTNMDKLQAMSEALIKYETIDEEQIKDIMEGRVPRPPRDWDDTPTPTPRGPTAEKPAHAARQSGGAALVAGPSDRRSRLRQPSCYWRCRHRTIDLTRPVVMGILNVTPDSFSDGGRYAGVDAALERAAQMVAEGACHHRCGRGIDAARRGRGRGGGGNRAGRAGHRGHRGRLRRRDFHRHQQASR